MAAIPGILLGLLMLAGLLVAHIAWCNEKKQRRVHPATSAVVARDRLLAIRDEDRLHGPIGPRRAAWYLRNIAARPPMPINCRCTVVPVDLSTEGNTDGQ